MGNNNTSGFHDAAEENSNSKVEETLPKSVQEAVTIVTDAKDDAGIDGDQIPDGAPEDGQDGTGGHFVVQSEGSDENGGRLGSEEPKAEEGAEGQNRDGKVVSEQEDERLESQVHDPLPVESGEENPEYEEERSKDSNPQLNIVRDETEAHKSDYIEQPNTAEEAETLRSGSTVMSPAHDEQEHQGSDEVESNLNENQGNSTSTNMERLESQLHDPLPAESQKANPECNGESGEGSNPQPNILREQMEERRSDLDEQQELHKPVEVEMSIGSPVMPPPHDGLHNHGSDEAELKLNKDEDSSTSTTMSPSSNEDPDSEELESTLHKDEGSITESRLSPTVEAEMSIGLPVMAPPHDGIHNHGSDEAELKLNEDEASSTSTIMSPSSDEEDPDSEELESNLHKDESSTTVSRLAHTTDLDVHRSYDYVEAVIIAENLKEGFAGNELIISLPSKISTKVVSQAAVENGTDHHEPESEQMSYNGTLQSQAEANLMAKHDHSNGDDEERSSNQAGRKIHGEEISHLEALNPEANLILTSLPPEATMEAAEESDVAGNNQDHQSENGSLLACSFVSGLKSNGSLTEAASKEKNMEVLQLGIPTIDSENKEHEPAQIHTSTVEVTKDHKETPQIDNGKEELLQESSPDQEKESVTESEDSPQDISSNSSWEFNTGNSSEFFVDMAPTFIADKLTDEEEPVPFPIQLPAAVTMRKEEANQQLGRLSTDSAPEKLTVDSHMQKSPSFNINLHLQRRSTEEYSDQTPLLRKYQDKNTITSPSKETNKAFEMPSHEEAMSVEEKVSQTLEKSDSEKPLILGWMKEDNNNNEVHRHNKASKEEMTKSVPYEAKEKQYGRRRSSIFSSCLCCAATNAIS